MFRSLALNTVISAVAFFAISIIGLLLVPLIVSAYGLELFGIIMLLRLMLPMGILGVLDFGFSEIATLAIVRARVHHSWNRSSAQISLLLLLALFVGLIVAIVFILGYELIEKLLNIGVAYNDDFKVAVRVTGLCLILLFPSLVFEGIIKGYEAYRLLRLIEVVSSLGYALMAIIVIHFDYSYVAVHYALLLSLLLKAIAIFSLSKKMVSENSIINIQRIPYEWHEVIERCRLMVWNKMLGVMQYQLTPLLIGITLTPLAVGIYDILVRLSRFIKSVLGLLNSSLLPFAARLDAAEDAGNMRRLGRSGFLIVALIVVPPLSWAAAFSDPILRLWIGADLARYWMWQAMTFVVPILNVFVSFGSSALMNRKHVIASMNRWVTVQIVFQFGISFLLLNTFNELSFILGQMLAVIITFIPQMRLIFREQGLGKELSLQLFNIGVVAATLVIISVVLKIQYFIETIFELSISILIWCLIFWLAAYFFACSDYQRRRLADIASDNF